MRRKIIKLLRLLEQENGFKNEYEDFTEEYGEYLITEYVDFPNYRSIVQKFNDKYFFSKKHGFATTFSSNSLQAELKRMEADGLVLIGIQEGLNQATRIDDLEPEHSCTAFTSESIVLTTRGKSEWRYFLYKVTENPVSLIFSSVALIISLVSLFM